MSSSSSSSSSVSSAWKNKREFRGAPVTVAERLGASVEGRPLYFVPFSACLRTADEEEEEKEEEERGSHCHHQHHHHPP